MHLDIVKKRATSSNRQHGTQANCPYDITVETKEGKRKKVQVKTMSEYSKTKIMSPIRSGWDELFVFYLGRDLKPKAFWILSDKSIVKGGKKLKGRKMPILEENDSPNKIYKRGSLVFGANRIQEFNRALKNHWDKNG